MHSQKYHCASGNDVPEKRLNHQDIDGNKGRSPFMKAGISECKDYRFSLINVAVT
jgi:hypothetical protein